MESTYQCRACSNNQCLKSVPLFASLSMEVLHTIAVEMESRTYQKGETIIREGQKAVGFTVIREGSAKAFRTTADGREQILYIFPVNDYFGARFLFTEDTVPYTVQALEQTKVCILSKDHFTSLLAQHSKLALGIIQAMANRMSRLESAMQSMGGRNAEMRIASFLLEFKDSYGLHTDQGLEITLPLSREGMANYLGLARETLSRKLAQMEEDGIITMVGTKSICILDLEKISQFAGMELSL